MLELGNVHDAANSQHVTDPIHNRIWNTIKATAPIEIADDDAAAAVILNQLHEQDGQKDSWNAAESSAYSAYSDVATLLAKLREPMEETNSFDGSRVGVRDKTEGFKGQAECGLEQVISQAAAAPGQNVSTQNSEKV